MLRGHFFKRQHWVQLNEVWRRGNLAMVAIEESHSSHSNNNWPVSGVWLREYLIQCLTRLGELGAQPRRACATTVRVGDLCDHRRSLILHSEQEKMDVAIGFR